MNKTIAFNQNKRDHKEIEALIESMETLTSDNNTEELEMQNTRLKSKLLETATRLFIEDLSSSSSKKTLTLMIDALNNHGINGLQYLLERTCESGKSFLFSLRLSNIRKKPPLNEKWERIEGELKKQSPLSEALELRLTKRALDFTSDTNDGPESDTNDGPEAGAYLKKRHNH